MLDKQEAKDRLLKCLNIRSFDDDKPEDTIVILDEATIERPYGWIFFYQSKKYLQTQHMRDMLVGNGPIIIEKKDGTMTQLSTGFYKCHEEEIREFEMARFGTSDFRCPELSYPPLLSVVKDDQTQKPSRE